MSGKAIARAIRGHFLVDSCLNVLLLHSTLDSVEGNQSESDIISENDMQELRSFYDGIVDRQMTTTEVSNSASFQKLEQLLTDYKNQLVSKSMKLNYGSGMCSTLKRLSW
jgi:hypothetical protein